MAATTTTLAPSLQLVGCKRAATSQRPAIPAPPSTIAPSRLPLSYLLHLVTSYRAPELEGEVASKELGPAVQALLDATSNDAKLRDLLAAHGWSVQRKGFERRVDVLGLKAALQKFRYIKVGELGSGTYGEVHKARNRETNESVAMKRLKYSSDASGLSGSTVREISTLKELKHENIVQLKDIITTLHGGHVYLVLECLDCDLRRYMDTCPDASDMTRIKSIVYQILQAVDHMHTNLIMHRDLKPQNILVDKRTGKVKVADFGLARQYLPPFKAYTERVVTLYYRAPELLLGAPHYSPAVDVWSVGCIMAELLNFQALFRSETEIGLLYRMFETLGTPSVADWPELSHFAYFNAEFPRWKGKEWREVTPRLADDPEGLNLLASILTYDPKHRITAKDALQHPWFRDVRS